MDTYANDRLVDHLLTDQPGLHAWLTFPIFVIPDLSAFTAAAEFARAAFYSVARSESRTRDADT